jgi:hypothetical protein
MNTRPHTLHHWFFGHIFSEDWRSEKFSSVADSGIRCFFYPWIRDSDLGWKKFRSGMNIPDYISESLETIFWVKPLKIQIRNKHPGSTTLKFRLNVAARRPVQARPSEKQGCRQASGGWQLDSGKQECRQRDAEGRMQTDKRIAESRGACRQAMAAGSWTAASKNVGRGTMKAISAVLRADRRASGGQEHGWQGG